jgi:3-methyladenine DNA glycosylase AlkD
VGPSARAVLRAIRRHADPERARIARRYFRAVPGEYGAGDRFFGVSVPVVRRLARQYDSMALPEVEALLQSPWHEARLLALLVMVRQYARGRPRVRRAIYRTYLHNLRHVNNWDLVDVSAEHIVGAHLEHRSRGILQRFARSRHLWTRRISLLATLHFIRHGEFADTLGLARMLLNDRHDLIHKATGWMLREVGKRDSAVLRAFLEIHASRMARVALRYATERLPASQRTRYLAAGR